MRRWLIGVAAVLMLAGAAVAQDDAVREQAHATHLKTDADAVDINHASHAELLRVPGLTEVWAARVVKFRPYRTKLDLLDRGILPETVYDQARQHLVAHREK